MMNIDIFILARSTSHRLPEKHLQKINGKTVIENLVNRLKKSKKIRKIIVCTTNLPSDDKFIKFLKKKILNIFEEVIKIFFKGYWMLQNFIKQI